MKSFNRTGATILVVTALLSLKAIGQTNEASGSAAPKAEPAAAEAKGKAAADVEKKAAEWAKSLELNDAAKESRVAGVIATHLKAVRDWHNAHPLTDVPAGINPTTGKRLSELERQVIADSTLPRSVHENLMSGLRKDLTEPQVEAVLDKYTVGKVAFTLKGYHAIVTNLTPEEESTILGLLKQAREEAVDYKDMNEISAIFKIYKTQAEQYLNANGRNWKQLYKAYVDGVKSKKTTDKQEK